MFLLTIYLPWILNMFPYSYWALTCRAALPSYSAFMISVRQASDLPPASFRFPVTRDTLALGYILPAVGRIRDFHPLKHAPAGRTRSRNGRSGHSGFLIGSGNVLHSPLRDSIKNRQTRNPGPACFISEWLLSTYLDRIKNDIFWLLDQKLGHFTDWSNCHLKLCTGETCKTEIVIQLHQLSDAAQRFDL